METVKDMLRWLLRFLLDKLGIQVSDSPFEMMRQMSGDLFPSTYTGGLYESIEKLIPIGILLAMIYVCKEMLEKTAIQNIDLEQIIKLFIKFLIAFAIVNNVGYIICGMNQFSDALCTEVGARFSSMGNPQDVSTAIFDALKISKYFSNTDNALVKGGGIFIDLIVLVISELIHYIIQMIFGIIIVFTSVTRAIKLGYKSIWAPIAVSNVIGYSTRNAAISYLKELLALFLQLPVAYLGYCVGMSIVNDAPDVLAKLIVYFATVVWVASSASISKELFT